jgi:hypothetical protein
MQSTAPRWLLWVSILLLVWNVIGIVAFISQFGMNARDIAVTDDIQRDLWSRMQPYVWVAYAVAVAGGTLGVVGLLLKQRWAILPYIVSLIAMIVQFTNPYLLHVANTRQMSIMTFPVILIAIAAVQVMLARHALKTGWLN